jgi:transcriptional regulator with XRE-family HTH domain
MKKATSASESKLARLRVERGLGQRELAEGCGVNIRQIQGLESGALKMENLSLKNALKLADFLVVHPRELV